MIASRRTQVPDVSTAMALTLRPPWGTAIADLGKHIENRMWETSRRGWLLIHQGKRWDPDGLPTITRIVGFERAAVASSRATLTKGAVVAVGWLNNICIEALRGNSCSCGPWAMPYQFHWQLTKVIGLADPVLATGRQQLWHPGNTLAGEVTEALRDTIVGVRLVCGGRARDRNTDPLPGRAGQPCGREYQGPPGQARADVYTNARLLNWRIGDTAMCPRCGTPER